MTDQTKATRIPLAVDEHPYAGILRWETLSNGDEHTLSLERPDEDIVSIVTELQQRYPRITWRISWDGIDFDDGSGRNWRVICVPEDEWSTAERMLDGWLGLASAGQRRFPNSK